MSFMFRHWFEDEYENITKGEVSSLQRENEELKRRVKELEGGISGNEMRKDRSLDECCTDCKEYDHENTAARDENKVIKETVNEIKAAAYKHGHSKGVKKGIEIGLRESITAQPQYEELTPEEAASEIASGSTMSAWYWLDDMMRLKQMGYAICRKR